MADDNNKADCAAYTDNPLMLAPDSDLGSRLVTVHVDCLPDHVIIKALRRGAGVAEDMRQSDTYPPLMVWRGRVLYVDMVTKSWGVSLCLFR